MRSNLASALRSFVCGSMMLATQQPRQATAQEMLARLTGAGPYAMTLSLVDPTGAETASALGPIQLLPIAIAGAYRQDELNADRPRVIAVGNEGPNVLLLPTQDGRRILHFARNQATSFGYLALDASGTIRILIERSSSTGSDPFDSRVGVSSTGDRLVVSLPADPGSTGEVWLIRTDDGKLEGDVTQRRILHGAGLAVPGDSFTFADDYVFAVHQDQLLRAPIDGTADLSPLSIPAGSAGGLPTYVSPLLARSQEGNRLAFLAGLDEQLLDVYVVDSHSGVVQRRSQQTAPVHPVYVYAHDPAAPHLALSDDGSQLAWKVRVGTEFELMLADGQQSASAPVHVTKAPDFETFIDTVGGILGSGTRMMFVAGSTYLGDADVYAVDFKESEDGGPIHNITATSGQSTPPFTSTHPAQMSIENRWRLGDVVLISDNQTAKGTGFCLWAVAELEESQLLAAALVEPVAFAIPTAAASHALLRLRSSTITTLHLISDSNAAEAEVLPAPVLALPSWIELSHMAIDGAGTTIALAAELAPGQSFIGVIPLDGAPAQLLPGGPLCHVDRLAFSRDGRLKIDTRTVNGAAESRLFDPTSGSSLTLPAAPAAWWIP